ncbi:TRAP transporter large permease [Peptostreptococcus porci]|uniref:TRAP transporter large permease n=1 Tax=Peptostreptococcus porci TaxID=2652282 RepID=UPI0023F28CB6|nr:TRAP transporter large permease subunit [Peptostreptococcus porci]MDD7182245.1 TRAP transporter large permease subunit [Peptostreptococcus porci]MDY4127770.1 TRAP transporter large permease subunit [Peptostreptococcus porci]MDY5963694.1 TRAP transporter large permease subunit [Peptostreptococcus porci]
MNLQIVSILFVIFLITGIPIGVVLCITSMIPNFINPLFPADPQYLVRAMISGVNSFPILAVPMFIFSGNVMAKGKISEKIFDFFSYFVVDKTAGLPIAVIITCMFYGAISGSGPATTAAVGTMTIPILAKAGYKKDFSTALVAVAGGIGVIIPPSIPFIFYGQASGVSISKLFIAGIIPGLLIGFSLMVYSWIYCKKNGEDKELILKYKKELTESGLKRIFFDSVLSLLCPIIVLGSIYTGIASPTEAAVISVFYSIILSLIVYKSIGIKDLWEIMVETVRTYSTILFIIAAAIAFSRVLIFLKVPDIISTQITAVVSSKIALLILVNLLLLMVGMIMDTTPAILVLTPILLPIVSRFGVDPIQFGIIMVVNLAIGFVTPPLGVNLFVASTISDVKMSDIVSRSVPFIISFLVVLLAITFIPALSMIAI